MTNRPMKIQAILDRVNQAKQERSKALDDLRNDEGNHSKYVAWKNADKHFNRVNGQAMRILAKDSND